MGKVKRIDPEPKNKIHHRIAFYIRVSTEDQAENPEGSIKNQEERLRAAVALKNMEGDFGEMAGAYTDRAKSGKDTNRPELQRMLAAIQRNEITLVMVSELSRLSRSIKDFSGIWELMQTHSCGFMSLRENFDTTTAAGEMVLYTIANIAQFERRQVSERVLANIQARASRGLYNGGVIPLGYTRDPEKKGYLIVNESQTQVVRAAFRALLKERSLTLAANWLNKNGYQFRRQTEGGGCRPRLGYFTVDNLHSILRNKAYLGIRVYKVKGELKETKAVWGSIIDEETFAEVQEILSKNFRRFKPDSPTRYPFVLTGITTCGTCRDHLCGKTANGNGGKIAYYEHGWATKRQACLVKKVFACEPNRILAKKIEPFVWSKVTELLCTPEIANRLLEEARQLHAKRNHGNEANHAQTKIGDVNRQLDALTERLSQIPKTVSASHIFKQMEKLEALKKSLEKVVIDRTAVF